VGIGRRGETTEKAGIKWPRRLVDRNKASTRGKAFRVRTGEGRTPGNGTDKRGRGSTARGRSWEERSWRQQPRLQKKEAGRDASALGKTALSYMAVSVQEKRERGRDSGEPGGEKEEVTAP